MKIEFFGDSITDAIRARQTATNYAKYGYGYVIQIAGRLMQENPLKHTFLNLGVGGERVVDLYARIKKDVWNNQPDVLSILVGVNDVWHEIATKNGVEIDRFERIYDMMIADTLKALPNLKIMICEPFVLKGRVTAEKFEQFKQVYDYAKVAKKLAEKYNLPFVALQDKFNEMAEIYGPDAYLEDGVHPDIAGSALIANEWLKVFKAQVEK